MIIAFVRTRMIPAYSIMYDGIREFPNIHAPITIPVPTPITISIHTTVVIIVTNVTVSVTIIFPTSFSYNPWIGSCSW